MRKTRSPLAFFTLSIVFFIILFCIVFVIVDINSKLAPDNQLLTGTTSDQSPGGILSITAWEFDRSGTVKDNYDRKEHYKPITMSPGREVLVVSAYNTEHSTVEPHPYLYISAYCDNSKLTAGYSLPIAYWGEPCGVNDFVPDKMNYAGEMTDIARRDSLMIYAAVNTRSEESFMNAQTDESGKPLAHSTRSERLIEVCPGASGGDAFVTRDISETTLIFQAFSNDLDEKLIAFAKVRVTYYSPWGFGLPKSEYSGKLRELGIDGLDSYAFATAVLVDYWESDNI